MILKPFLREHLMPLPVTFISTISKDGIRNIAPWSCIMPILRPLDLICAASAKKRDTLTNIKDTKEFVVNLAGQPLADKVIPTARYSPPETDEFIEADIAEKPSVKVKAPGIAGSYAWMECTLDNLIEEDNYALIIGKVVHLELNDDVADAEDYFNLDAATPLLMIGGKKAMRFCTVKDLNMAQPFSAMFPDGKDPLRGLYEEK